jgi:uncharacterized membrane protein
MRDSTQRSPWKTSLRAIGWFLAGTIACAYPVGIWIGLTHWGPRTIGIWVIACIVPVLAWRLRKARRDDRWAVLRIPLIVLGLITAGAILDDARFFFAMPVLINVALLITFASSLGTTPIIERFARMQEKEGLSEGQVAHCRQITWAWCAFFVVNAAIAALLAWLAPVSWWAAYTGGIAYGLMGTMFAGELILRRYRFRNYGNGLHDRLLSRIFPPR